MNRATRRAWRRARTEAPRYAAAKTTRARHPLASALDKHGTPVRRGPRGDLAAEIAHAFDVPLRLVRGPR